jgi:hypothetical protein
MEFIKFDNKFYPIREIEIPECGNVKISTSQLNSKFMNEDGSYSSEKAIYLDENIFYYVDPIHIMLEDSQLINLIMSEL